MVEALPTIIENIVAVIPKIIDSLVITILDSIPLIIDAGVKLLISLVENLPTIIETILLAIPEIITNLVNALIGSIDKIIEAGVKLFTSLITNLPQIITELVKAIPQIMSAIISGFANGQKQMADIGKNLVKGLWEGIQSLAGWLTDKVSDWANGLWSGIKGVFGIHSPSKKMAWIGNMLMEGMANGIDDSSIDAVKSVNNATDEINDAFNNLESDANLNVHTDVDDNAKTSILDSLSDVYVSLRNSIKDGLYSMNDVSEQSQLIEVRVPIYLDSEEITNVTSKVQSGRTASYKRAMGV